MFKNQLLQIAPVRDAFSMFLRRKWVSLSNDYSVTDLITPPRIVQLRKRHAEELYKLPITEMELRNAEKAFMGTGIHSAFEKNLWSYMNNNPGVGYLVERKIWDKIRDRKIVGKFDCYLNGALYDFKTTSVWKRIYGQYSDFEDQLNIYAYLLRADVPVNLLYIIAWYTDWDKWKARQQSDYPKTPIEEIRLSNLWDVATQKKFLEDLIEKHKANENLPDTELYKCTPKETWEKPTQYAIKAPGAGRAVRVLDSMDEVKAYIDKSTNKEKDTWEVETRGGHRQRCEEFCKVNIFCDQYQEYMQKKVAS